MQQIDGILLGFGTQMAVSHGHGDRAVTQEFLYHRNRRSSHDKVASKGMPEDVPADMPQTGLGACSVQGAAALGGC